MYGSHSISVGQCCSSSYSALGWDQSLAYSRSITVAYSHPFPQIHTTALCVGLNLTTPPLLAVTLDLARDNGHVCLKPLVQYILVH